MPKKQEEGAKAKTYGICTWPRAVYVYYLVEVPEWNKCGEFAADLAEEKKDTVTDRKTQVSYQEALA